MQQQPTAERHLQEASELRLLSWLSDVGFTTGSEKGLLQIPIFPNTRRDDGQDTLWVLKAITETTSESARLKARHLFQRETSGGEVLLAGIFQGEDLHVFHRYLPESNTLCLPIPEKKPHEHVLQLWNPFIHALNLGESAVRALFHQVPEETGGKGWNETLRQRKEKGRYYTPFPLAFYLVDQVISPYFQKVLAEIENATSRGEFSLAVRQFETLLQLKICDPSLGGGVFLAAALQSLNQWFDPLSSCFQSLSQTSGLPSAIEERYSFLRAAEAPLQWERFVLSHTLYGVDVDPQALVITQALIKTCNLRNREVSPMNLGLGNGLISPLSPQDRLHFAQEFQKELIRLIALRTEAGPRGLSEDKTYREIQIPIWKTCCERRLSAFFPKEHWDYNAESASGLRPFLWELEFPEVFFDDAGNLKPAPGFQFILGNPPWEKVKPNAREYLRSEGQAPARDYLQQKALERAFLKHGGDYPFQTAMLPPGTAGRNKAATSDDNLYKLFMERTCQLLAPTDSQACLIVKNGFRGDHGTTGLRRLLLEEYPLKTLWEFRNKSDDTGKIFPDVDPNERFLAAHFAPRASHQPLLNTIAVSTLEGLLVGTDNRTQSLTLEEIKHTSPQFLEIPVFRSDSERQVMSQLSRFPSLSSNPWGVTWGREIDMTLDRSHFRETEPAEGRPLWEGSLIAPFEMSTAPKRWVDTDSLKRNRKDFPDSEKTRLVIRLILPNSVRKLNATLVPPGILLGNSLGYVRPNKRLSPNHLLYLCACLNSLVAEFWIRQRVTGMTLNFFRLSQLPVPEFRSEDTDVLEIVALSSELLGESVMAEQARFLRYGHSDNPHQRKELRHRLEILIARRYQLAPEDWQHVVQSYRLPESEKEKLIKAF